MMSANVNEVPPALAGWFGRVGGKVAVRYQEPNATHAKFYEGKLKTVAATGAYIRLSGVLMDDATTRTVELPLDYCTLLPRRRDT